MHELPRIRAKTPALFNQSAHRWQRALIAVAAAISSRRYANFVAECMGKMFVAVVAGFRGDSRQRQRRAIQQYVHRQHTGPGTSHAGAGGNWCRSPVDDQTLQTHQQANLICKRDSTSRETSHATNRDDSWNRHDFFIYGALRRRR